MIVVLINPTGGTAKNANAVSNLKRLLAERLPEANVEVIPKGADIAERARAACAGGARVVAAAGGDGTLSAVAQALVGNDVRLGVLPFGTRNHFARDLHVPLDLSQAVDLLGKDSVRQIDVGRVNDHYFLNNASLGIYPELVDLRDREAHSVSKTLRMLLAAAQLIGQAQPLGVDVRYGNKRVREAAWLVFVGNNSYHMGIFKAGRRIQLDTGCLDVVVVPARRRQLARMALKRAEPHPQQIVRAEIQSAQAQVLDDTTCTVACDGEDIKLKQPLAFRSMPRALWVIAPA
jgi:YegS/Rv2252/BmrU family lipid kinase